MRRLSGRLRSALIIGGQGVRARKTRTLLSMVSLFLGVLAVVAVQAGADTAQRALLANVELTEGVDGTHQLYVSGEGPVGKVVLDTLTGTTGATALVGTMATIGEPGVAAINAGGSPFDQPGYYGSPSDVVVMCDQYGNCSKVVGGGARPAPPGAAIDLNLVAMTADVRPFRPFRPVSGNWLDFDSAPSFAPRLVLNKEAAKGFSRYQIPAQMRVPGATHDATPQIIGVVDDGVEQPRAYTRADELTNWVNPDKLGGSVEVLLSPDASNVEDILKRRLQAVGLPSDQVYTRVINSKQHIQSTLALLRGVFFGMAALVLLIGVAGILNVGLATVGERVEEFALRRAVGTPRLLLAGIVLAETLLTGLFTAAALRVIGPLLETRDDAGLLGGLVPAIRAARIPIAAVMRA